MHPVLKYAYRVVDCAAPLRVFATKMLDAKDGVDVAMDIEALCHSLQPNQPKSLGDISLIQLCCPAVDTTVNIVDVLTLGRDAVRDALGPILEAHHVRKLMFDCRRDVEALSSQLQLRPRRVLDLQLCHAGAQWKLRASDRRSGLQYVLKQELGIDRAAGDAAVSKAMTLGNRPVWDVRPLPEHFLEYAADDVRHLYALFDTMRVRHAGLMDSAERISEEYTAFYAQGKPVEEEADSKSQLVRTEWLERYFGPAGVCAFCGVRGHHIDQCFKKSATAKDVSAGTTAADGSASASSSSGGDATSTAPGASSSPVAASGGVVRTVLRCGYCGGLGHIATSCFKKNPQLLKCGHCQQMGHNDANCFVKHPCEFCGGKHRADKCLKRKVHDEQAAATNNAAGSQ